MIFILLFTVIAFYSIFAIIRSGKSLKHIAEEVKFEFIFNLIGAKALWEDKTMQKGNKIKELPDKKGQFAVVTGGGRGIGLEVVKMLMQSGMHVIIGIRNANLGETIEKKFRDEGVKTGELKCFQLDTSSVKSVKEFAEKIKELYPKIHVLVNNAGIMLGPYVKTEDGFESQFAVNYLGHFLLSHLLLPQIKNAGTEDDHSRIVNVSSIAHFANDINYDDIHFEKQYIASQAYGQSKLAQVMSTAYLQKKFDAEKTPVDIFSVHPGLVDTDLFNTTPLKKLFPWLPSIIFKDGHKGATPIVYASISKELEHKGGTYLTNCKIKDYSGFAKNAESLEKLFQLSKALLNIGEFGTVN